MEIYTPTKKEIYENNVIIPLKSDKSPKYGLKWTEYNLENKVAINDVEKSEYVGFVAGFNNITVVDIDNHFGDADAMFQRIYDNMDVSEIPVIKTQGGGYHIYLRSINAFSSQKLATRYFIENDESKHTIDDKGNHRLITHGKYTVSLRRESDGNWYGESTLIETKGIGGYVVCPPSPGYVLMSGDLSDVKEVTEDFRFKLIGLTKTFDEKPLFIKEEKPKHNVKKYDGDRMGDLYNSDSSNLEPTKQILRQYGWKSTNNKEDEWTRPGKEGGVSATLGRVGFGTFYVFSPNAAPFEQKKSYSMFAVKSLLEFNGDYVACAKSMAPEKPIEKPYVLEGDFEAIDFDGVKPKKKREVSQYIRIGDNYYKNVVMFDKYGNESRKLVSRSRQTLIDDYGKTFIQTVDKFDDFCNIPSHLNYEQAKGEMFNMYNPLNIKPTAGEFPMIRLFLEHIFGEQVEMGYDYFKILYEEPTHILPVICLVSKENQTGKSTFGNFIHTIFGSNYANIGSSELNTEFNSSYATKLVAMVDEGRIDYKVIDKLKHMSTSPTIQLRQMRKDHTPIDFFCKFVLCSNRVKEFIIANKEDQRYWVLKIPRFKHFDPNFLSKLQSEVPYFVHFLLNRELSTPRESRMHFSPASIRTSALEDVVRNSLDVGTKDFIEMVLAVMEAKDLDVIDCTLKDLKDTFFHTRNDISASKIKDILTDFLELQSSPYPVTYEFLKDPITKKGRIYSIKRELLMEKADVNYGKIDNEDENLPF